MPADTKVLIDQEFSALLSDSLFRTLSLAEKLFAVLVPLHTGRGLPQGYLVVLLAFSALGCLMTISALISFARKKRGRLALAPGSIA